MQRREHGRYRMWFPVRVSGSDAEAMAVNQDVSAGGMLVAVTSRLEVGEAVSVTFSVPPAADAMHTLRGRILRIEDNQADPEGTFPYRVAVEFDSVAEELLPFLEQTAQYLTQ